MFVATGFVIVGSTLFCWRAILLSAHIRCLLQEESLHTESLVWSLISPIITNNLFMPILPLVFYLPVQGGLPQRKPAGPVSYLTSQEPFLATEGQKVVTTNNKAGPKESLMRRGEP